MYLTLRATDRLWTVETEQQTFGLVLFMFHVFTTYMCPCQLKDINWQLFCLLVNCFDHFFKENTTQSSCHKLLQCEQWDQFYTEYLWVFDC